MTQLYHPTMYDTARKTPSYWEDTAGPEVTGWHPLERDETCDVAIIGGGYTGLSAAYHLARDHGIAARVLEAGPPGWGASGRNGGFCGPGGAKLGIAQMIGRFGLAEAQRYYAAGREAVELVRDLGRNESIDFDAQGEGEFAVAPSAGAAASLPGHAEALTRVLGLRCEALTRDAFAERGYRGPECHGALFMPVGFGLHPLKFVRGLARAALRRGVAIHGHSKVERWETVAGEHRLHTRGGTLTARRVIIATNGYTEDRLHRVVDGVLLPAISSIITTRPLTDAERQAQSWTTACPIWDNRNLFCYFRMLKDGRFLIGTRGNTDATPDKEHQARDRLVRRLGEMWPAWQGIEISHAWRGFVCLSRALAPQIGTVPDDPSIGYALAYHGSGVAWANWSGRAVARLMFGNAPPLPAVVRAPLRPFPLAGLRVLYLRGAYLAYVLKDRSP